MPDLTLDMQDDYPWLPGSTRFPVADLGELAARLGSPVTFDRRGEVLWYDIGNHGLSAYTVGGSGYRNEIYVDCAYTLHGGYTYKMVAGSDSDLYSYLVKILSNIGLQHMGLEVAFALLTPNDYFLISALFFDGSQMHRGIIKVKGSEQTLCYEDKNGNDIPLLSGIKFDDPYGVTHHIKLVMNFETGYYERLLFDTYRISLADIQEHKSNAPDIPQYRLRLRQQGRLGYNDTVAVFHIIVTGNET